MKIMRQLFGGVAVALLTVMVFAMADSAQAFEGPFQKRIVQWQQSHSWHGNYYHTAWGGPVPLVVPPTAVKQTHWGATVGSTRISPVIHQYHPGFPGSYGAYNRSNLRPTPRWPSSTDQFGVYYIRAPW